MRLSADTAARAEEANVDNSELEQRIAPLIAAGLRCLEDQAYDDAATLYKRALRQVRDALGPCHLLIAQVFELLEQVHHATGKEPKCRAIRRRVRVIRDQCHS